MTSAAIAGRSTVHLKVLSAGAVKYVLTDFAPRFTHDTGDQVEFTFGTIGGVQKRLGDGETADIIMGTAPAISQMEQSGVIVAGSRADLGRTLTGICVRADTPMPDISTPDGFKQTLLKARSSSVCSSVSVSPRRSARRPCSASMATRSSTRFPRATPRSARPSSARSCR
jgi:molybdate transport system substrate-binding protein